MLPLLVAAHLVLPLLVASAAGLGAWRCWRLLRYAEDPRLQRLMWFYGLFAASLVAFAIWMGRLAVSAGEDLPGGDFPAAFGSLHGGFAAGQRVDVFLVVHHALMLASLGVAVEAFRPRRLAPLSVAAAGLAFVGPSILLALAVEALLTLYLAVRAVLNHRRRPTPGALQVAAGFLFFFLGHLSLLAFYVPGSARNPIGDALSLVGIVILVRLLPRPTA